MINLRYHVVSLVAVFLALAVGIVMGATVLNKGTASVLNVPANALRVANERYRSENAELRDQNAVLQQFGQQELPGLVAGRLAGRAVVVVDTDQVADGARTSVTTALAAAGAESVGRLTLSSRLLLLENPADRGSLSKALGVASDNVDELRGALADALAARLSAPSRLTTNADPAGDLLTSLNQAKFLSLSGLPAQYAAGTTPFPPARTLFVVVGPGQPSAGVDPKQLLIPLAGKIAAQTLRPVVAVEPSGGKLSWVGALRQDPSVRSRVSTVDDVETVPGEFSLVMALQQAEGGAVGHYGVRSDADRLFAPRPGTKT